MVAGFTMYLILVVGYSGWGSSYTGVGGGSTSSQQQQDEAQFNSLFPMSGFVTGTYVMYVTYVCCTCVSCDILNIHIL